MLLGGAQTDTRQVAVVTRNVRFRRLLCSILEAWKFCAVDDLSAAHVVFAERGIPLHDFKGVVVWLTPMPLPDGLFLTTPISLTGLFRLLETDCFPNPRRHIRIALDVRTEVTLENAWHSCQLTSISDRGGRIVCEHEIPRGTRLTLETTLAGRFLKLPAEVLYSIPGGDAPGRPPAQIGVLFRPAEKRVLTMLRRFIEKNTVESACDREGISRKDPSLSWFELSEDPWNDLAG